MRKPQQGAIRVVGRALWGAALATMAALALALLAAGRPHRMALPLLFIVVLLAVGARYGVAAAVIGSLAAALIFAHFLFAPEGSFAVSDATARTNLGWMVLGAVVPAYLLNPGHSSHKDT